LELFFSTLLNGLQLSMLVFLLAAGLTLIFGLMNILNLAHGAFYTIGAYAGLVIAREAGSFWLALVLAPVVPFVFGAVLQYWVLQPLSEQGRSSHLDLALLTFGLLFATAGSVEILFGPSFQSIQVPQSLSGTVSLFGLSYPKYRLFIIGLGLLCALLIWLLLERTLLGATVRAGVDDREMIVGMGINIRRVFALVFGAGAALGGLGGVVAAPVLGIYSHMGISIMVITFVVVVVGGLGNIKGSFVGSLIVGLVNAFIQSYLPDLEMFALYLLLIAIMTWRPAGLFSLERRVA
jgi:branched-chain amino acid transport system permease protein